MTILHNEPLISAVIAWFIAQFLKVIIHLVKNKDFDLSKFFASGGMPSSHSSTVTGLALSVGLTMGFESVDFAMAAIFATIIMYDASGVRLAVSKHAKILNDFFHGRIKNYKALNELVGHTSYEVVVGAIIGIIVAIIVT
ncbi:MULTISPECIES: divergent PAP2 family protein [Gottfriedia]|uniref:Membrane protein n=1 Tax=Gottfriedia solisilvae TaxID=1516104 RepID=A0A8J3AEN2_9BACI|nr:divergent PAP2 family protein [Gottfriedia solisilvae]GGI11276.1 membrane protein [Gottfriedia solisilvae]